MTKLRLFAAAAALSIALPALGQESQPPSATAPAEQFVLPEGAAKQTVETTCVACHDLRRVVHSNYSPEEWHNVVNMMVSAGAPLSASQKQAVTDYLIANFPGKPKPAPVIVPGPVKVSFQEWQVPTPGSRPHDPLATPDGAIWYTGQMANKLGRLDPTTGLFREYPLDTPFSGPHGLTYDKDGNIWFAANFAGYIGKLDPKTGAIAEYKMPDPAARDPHTPLFDKDGILWFTLQNANMVGRLDPKTGAIKLVTMPTPKSQPYGMVFTSDGDTIFFDMFGTNKIASIDRKTMAIKEYPLPDNGSRPRRIAITKDDIIWYGDYSRGRLGRLDPKTGMVTEYPSPGGPRTQPYAITTLDDVIWYVEAGLQPNALVRFDPKTEQFQTWAIPSGGGVVRNMMPTPDGRDLALAYSGVNGIGLATIDDGRYFIILRPHQ
jgi:virginiamycin B lyase